MGDAGMAILSLELEDDSVMDNNKIMVAGELEIGDESVMVETSETRTIVYKSASCQVDLSSQDIMNLPILFCGLHSSSCEASTQCDIPLIVSHSLSAFAKEVCISARKPLEEITKDSHVTASIQNEVDKAFQTDIIRDTIEDVILNNAGVDDLDSFQKDNQDAKELAEAVQKDPPRTSKRGRRKKPREDSDFDWDDDDDFWEEKINLSVNAPSRRRARKTKHSGSAETKPQSPKLREREKSPRLKESLYAEQVRAGIKSVMEPMENVTPYIELVTEKEWCNDWITDDEVDDDEDLDPSQEEFGKNANDKISSCSHCMLKFSTPLLLLQHTEANHSAHICNICGFTATFKHKLKRHMVKHTNVKAFVCDICGKQYSQNQNLKDHISRAHSDQDHCDRYPFSCVHCKRLYRDERNYVKHQEQCSGPCDICGLMFKCSGQLWLHRREHYSHCNICEKGFQSRGSLLLHKSMKHGEKTLQCPKCPKKFVFQSHLRNHFDNAHNKAAPQFKCEACGFCTKSMTYLKAHHSRMHKNPSKVYSCDHCNKNFRSKARVIEHVRIHTGERPFSCPVCLKTFYSQSNLYAHERTVHGRLKNYGTKETEENTGEAIVRRQISSCYQCHLCQLTCPTHKKLKHHLLKDHNFSSEDAREQKIDSVEVICADESVVTSMGIDMGQREGEGTSKDSGIMGNENVGVKATVSVPSYVVPPNVNLVEIEGVQYQVIRNSQ
ncbi:zinc finger protein 836-like [Penaeus indicus]|uniref:zinc finger protein 836-like n=1 Tax=Penaeus indicus TaxID=29960 RepID=UPI00300C636B